MRYSHSHTQGYSLVEVLVAISILMLSIVGPITIAAKSLQSAQYVRQQNTAFFLAQEGISIANTLRNDGALDAVINGDAGSWEWVSNSALAPCFTSTGCDIDFRDKTLTSNVVDCSDSADACTLLYDADAPRAMFQHSSGDTSIYTRKLTFVFATSDEVKVTSDVSWATPLLGGTQTVSLSTSLFNIYK